jgi:hypothetical protein
MLVAVTLSLQHASSASCVEATLREGVPVVEGGRGGSHAAGATCGECIAFEATLPGSFQVVGLGR